MSRTGSMVAVVPKRLALATRHGFAEAGHGSAEAFLVDRTDDTASPVDDAGPACRGHDPRLWDIDHDIHTSLFSRCPKCVQAVRICRSCPIRLACGAEGVRFGDVATIRGGRALAPAAEGKTEPVPDCELCGLPVLRGRGAQCCSVLCTRMRAAARSAKPVAA